MSERPKRLLLVDDAELFLELERTFLQRTGYHIYTARSGEEALRIARDIRPDLVLLDLNMPCMDGDEVCREIKDDPNLKDVHVVMVTARGRDEDRALCIEGCDGYLTKPINRAELLACVQQALNERVRSLPRVPVALDVRWRTDDGLEGTGRTSNVSAGGLFVICETPLPRITPHTVEFALPGARSPFRLEAEVVWNTIALKQGATTPGFGLRFSTPPHEPAAVLKPRALAR
jgi:uncharacterized protein (TIGR02266 family)